MKAYRWISNKTHDHCINDVRVVVSKGDIIELDEAMASMLGDRIKLLVVEEAEAASEAQAQAQAEAPISGELDLEPDLGKDEWEPEPEPAVRKRR